MVSVLKLADIYILFTCVVVAVARRLGLIGRSGSDGVIRWLIYTPKGGETHCSGIIIHFVWTGPDDPGYGRGCTWFVGILGG